MSTIHDKRYRAIIKTLIQNREEQGIKQQALSARLGKPQSYVSKVEIFERRLDIIELYDWLNALQYNVEDFLKDIGWIKP